MVRPQACLAHDAGEDVYTGRVRLVRLPRSRHSRRRDALLRVAGSRICLKIRRREPVPETAKATRALRRVASVASVPLSQDSVAAERMPSGGNGSTELGRITRRRENPATKPTKATRALHRMTLAGPVRLESELGAVRIVNRFGPSEYDDRQGSGGQRCGIDQQLTWLRSIFALTNRRCGSRDHDGPFPKPLAFCHRTQLGLYLQKQSDRYKTGRKGARGPICA